LKISVAILAYNAERYIRDAITSIVNQDYPGEIEIVVAYDEGSTDNTLQILDEVKEYLPLHRKLLVFNHKHTTPFRARLYCLEKFTGDYMHMFDYDNIMPSNRISRVVEHIKRSGAEFLFSNAKIVDANGRDMEKFLANIEQPYNFLRLIRGNYIDINTMVISKLCARKLRDALIRLNHRYFDWLFEDWLLALLCMKHCKVHYMDDTIIWYRIHEANITAKPDVLTHFFNKERRLKTLLAFYTIEHNNLSMLEKREFQKALIAHSNFLDRMSIEYLDLNQIKIFYRLGSFLYRIFLKL
jgi:glycosyltransferase involved in cell wall biosynthesis